jgi:hypothetical protein
MKALTIWQPWASLIIAGAKPFEFRGWAFPKSLQGQRIVIHAGARAVKPDEVLDLIWRLQKAGGSGTGGTGLKPEIALPILEKLRHAPKMLPLAHGLGTGVLGTPRRASALFAGDVADSDRVNHSIIAWPLTDSQPFEPPMPARGAQGFWDWAA